MIAILLWITLILSVLALIIIASPLKFSCNFSYSKPDTLKYGLFFSYLHPLVFSYVQMSEDREPHVTICGFRMKNKDVADDNDIAEIDNIADGGAETYDLGDVKGDDIDDSGNENDINASNNNVNHNNIIENDTEPDLPPPKNEKRSLISRIKSYVAEIKENKLYMIYENKPLRTKLLKWAYRLPGRTLKSIPLDNLKLHTTIGYRKNPAVLGKTYGYFNAARSALLRDNPAIDVSMRPIFNEDRFEIDTKLSIKTSISIILWQLSVILLTFPYLRIYKIYRGK